MAVKVRLRRMGGRNKPFYRIVATDSRYATSGRFLEIVGWYDPTRKLGENFELDTERVGYWKANGAELSNTVTSLLKLAVKRPARPVPAAEPAPAPEPAAAEAEPAETAQA